MSYRVSYKVKILRKKEKQKNCLAHIHRNVNLFTEGFDPTHGSISEPRFLHFSCSQLNFQHLTKRNRSFSQPLCDKLQQQQQLRITFSALCLWHRTFSPSFLPGYLQIQESGLFLFPSISSL